MARKKLPDHEGRLPNHPRYGNPSDPAEEAARIGLAIKNLDDWQSRTGAQFSGGVTMQYGERGNMMYSVDVGDKKIAQAISGRPITADPVKALPEKAESAPEPAPLPKKPPPQFWAWRMVNKIMEPFR